MNQSNNLPKPILILDGKAFDLSKIDFSNTDDDSAFTAHVEAWLKKKEKAFARAEKKKRSNLRTSRTPKTRKVRSANVRFLTFVKAALPTDPAMKSFYDYLETTAVFSRSSDPRILATYLYLHLNPLQTKGFQLYMIMYKEQPDNQLPKDLQDPTAFLDAINGIVHLQNSDPNYRHS